MGGWVLRAEKLNGWTCFIEFRLHCLQMDHRAAACVYLPNFNTPVGKKSNSIVLSISSYNGYKMLIPMLYYTMYYIELKFNMKEPFPESIDDIAECDK